MSGSRRGPVQEAGGFIRREEGQPLLAAVWAALSRGSTTTTEDGESREVPYGRTVVGVLLLYLFASIVVRLFWPRAGVTERAGQSLPDDRFGYDTVLIDGVMSSMGGAGRRDFLLVLAVDAALAVVLGVVVALLTRWVYVERDRIQFLLGSVVPVLLVALTWLQTGLLGYVTIRWPDQGNAVVSLASTVTTARYLVLGLALAALAVVGALRLIRWADYRDVYY